MKIIDLPMSKRLSTGAIAKYALLPGILPRLKNLSFSFQKILFVFIQILGAADLIDRNHPCLRPENIGQYSLSEALVMAWKRLKFDREHILQIMMFAAVIAAIVLMIAMVFMAGAYFFTSLGGTAHAQYFSMPDGKVIPYKADDDWAFQYLERVFGGQQDTGLDFWGTGDIAGGAGNPWFTSLFIGMMKTYSKALLFLALFMILYLILITLADAARTGQPFGKKFDGVWAPIRFGLAIGLLVPISGSGYNGGQMLVFEVAELGSNLATNLWHKGISTDQSDLRNFVTANTADPGYRFVRDAFLINLCVDGFNQLVLQKKLVAYDDQIDTTPTVTNNGKTITFSYGNSDSSDFCGSIVLPVAPEMPVDFPSSGDNSKTPPIPGRTAKDFLPATMASNFKQTALLFMPGTNQDLMSPVSEAITKDLFCDRDKDLTTLKCDSVNCTKNVGIWVYKYWSGALGRKNPDDAFFKEYDDALKAYNGWIYESVKKDAAHGWASAGAFYIRMTYSLSLLDTVITAQPFVSKLPTNFYKSFATPDEDISNEVGREKCGMKSATDSVCSKYAGPEALYNLLHRGYDWFQMAPKLATADANNLDFYQRVAEDWDKTLQLPDQEPMGSNNANDVMDSSVAAKIFDRFKINSTDLHPLGQVVGWGNLLINIASTFFATSIVMGIVGLAPFGGIATSLSMLTYTIGQVLIVPGFILMFVVPLLPFLYFTFAVIEWVVAVAEAVIGMPLWALSFITLRGDLAGQAMGGIKMLFEIMLRPTIIVFSLLAAIIIFTASVTYFNDSLLLYMDAYGNAGKIGVVGSFGMIFIYMFSVYVLATSCFKLIDAIPNEFGRWVGLGHGFEQGMSNMGSSIAITSAVVARQGTSLVQQGLATGGSAVRNELTARDRQERHDEWREGKGEYEKDASGNPVLDADGNHVFKRKGEFGQYASGFYKAAPGSTFFAAQFFSKDRAWEYDSKKHDGEIERVRKANTDADKFNAALPTLNAGLVSQGFDALDPKQHQNDPSARDMSYMRNTVSAGMADANRIPGSMYSKTQPSGTQGPNVPINPQQPQQRRSFFGRIFAPVFIGAATLFGVNAQAGTTAAGRLNTSQSATTLGSTTIVEAASGFGKKPTGEPYKLEEVKKHLNVLGLKETATPGEISKAMDKLRKNGFMLAGQPLPKGKSASEVQGSYKQRAKKGEDAYEALQRALRFGKFSNT